jgi:hypothetical protein
MDDPTRWCENDTDKWKRAIRGSCSQARAPFFYFSRPVGQPFLAVLTTVKFLAEIRLINLPRYRDIQMPQNVLHFRIPQA